MSSLTVMLVADRRPLGRLSMFDSAVFEWLGLMEATSNDWGET